MSSHHRDDDTHIWQALVVQEFGDDDVDALDYLAETSRADDGRDPVERGA